MINIKNYELKIKNHVCTQTVISSGFFNSVSCHARFLGKILPERSEAWRFFPKPEGLDLAGQSGHGITFAR